MNEVAPDQPRQSEPALESGVMLAGNRLLVSMWLAVILVASRVALQVYIDHSSEGLRKDLLLEHAVEHVLLVYRDTWLAAFIAVLTFLPRGRTWVAWLRGVLAFAASCALLTGWPSGEIQYRPSMESTLGLLGLAAVSLVAVVVVLLDRWSTSPRRFFYRFSPATRFMVTSLILLLGGGAVVTNVKIVEIRRDYMAVQKTVVDLLDELPNAEIVEQLEQAPVTVGAILPSRNVMELGGNKPSLVMSPQAQADFQVQVEAACRFTFSCGVDQRSFRGTAGSRFRVNFQVSVNGEERFQLALNPFSNEDDRGWFDGEIDLSEDLGEVTLSLRTDLQATAAVPIHAGFGRPLIVRDERVARTVTAPEAMNVVVIMADTLRADHLHCYGYPRRTSPAIDALASQGIRYARAQAPASWTWPTVASVMTGWYPARHGVIAEDRCFLSDSLQTLAERMQQRPGGGLTTGGWSANPLISKQKNFQQGFEVWKEFHFRPGAFVTREFGDFVRRYQGYQFFAYLHYIDPHHPYVPPERFRKHFASSDDMSINRDLDVRALELARGGEVEPLTEAERQHIIDLYDEEIRSLDHELRRVRQILESLDLWDRTIVVFTSDHGEEFLDHGGLTHGWTLYRELLHVPLIIRDPREQQPGRVVDQPVNLTQLPATLLTLVDGPVTQNLQPALPPWGAPPDWIIAHTERGILGQEVEIPLWSMERNGFKLITNEDGSWLRLFEVHADPGESKNLADQHPDLVSSYQQRLTAWREAQERDSKSRAFDEVDAHTRRALDVLGYNTPGR